MVDDLTGIAAPIPLAEPVGMVGIFQELVEKGACYPVGTVARPGATGDALRAAIAWLRQGGLEIEINDRGEIRVPHPIEPLREEHIRSGLYGAACGGVKRIDVLAVTGSTNQVLVGRARGGSIHGHVCLAEFQTAGRGRRGRRWVVPLGAGACMSVGWGWSGPRRQLPVLGVVAALGVVRALERFGLRDIGIKWPNDVLWRHRKLAGTLVETRAAPNGGLQVIVGIGINVAFPTSPLPRVSQPYADVRMALGYEVSRNVLASAVISELFGTFNSFQSDGFAGFETEWRRHDLVSGKMVELTCAGGTVAGEVQAMESEGTLIVRVEDSIHRFNSADICLRIKN